MTQNNQNQTFQTIWELGLNYGGKIYYIKSKNPKRTLFKIINKTNKPDEVAIRPPRSYYWYITTLNNLKKLVDGEEVELPIVFHYPPRGGDGVGRGWLKLP